MGVVYCYYYYYCVNRFMQVIQLEGGHHHRLLLSLVMVCYIKLITKRLCMLCSRGFPTKHVLCELIHVHVNTCTCAGTCTWHLGQLQEFVKNHF